jgi:hypothetical protein
MRINDKNINRQIDAPWIGWCDAREFILFFLPPHKEKRNPAHKTAHPAKTHKPALQPIFAGRAVFFAIAPRNNIKDGLQK